MPTRAVYTPAPRESVLRRTAFEYIALVRVQVESSFIHINPALDRFLSEAAILKPARWIRNIPWPPTTAAPERRLVLAAMTKVMAYFDLTARTRAGTSAKLGAALEQRYAKAYEMLRGPDLLSRLAVFRAAAVIDEDGQPSWGYRIVSEGELPPGLEEFTVAPGRMDELAVFLQAAMTLDLLRKTELISEQGAGP